MCQPNTSPALRSQIRSEGTNYTTVLTLPWMLAFGTSTLRVVDEMRGEDGTLLQVVRYRFAETLKSRPGAWNDSGTSRSSDGIGVQDFDISETTDQMWVQVGLAAKATSGAAEALSMLQAAADSEGKTVANRKLQIQPRLNDGKTMVIPLCDPLPAVGFSDMIYAINLYGLNGDITIQAAFRTFDADTIIPNSWSTSGISSENVSVDSATATEKVATLGKMTPTLGTSPKPMYVQPGLQITSTDDDLRCMIEVTVAAKW